MTITASMLVRSDRLARREGAATTAAPGPAGRTIAPLLPSGYAWAVCPTHGPDRLHRAHDGRTWTCCACDRKALPGRWSA